MAGRLRRLTSDELSLLPPDVFRTELRRELVKQLPSLAFWQACRSRENIQEAAEALAEIRFVIILRHHELKERLQAIRSEGSDEGPWHAERGVMRKLRHRVDVELSAIRKVHRKRASDWHLPSFPPLPPDGLTSAETSLPSKIPPADDIPEERNAAAPPRGPLAVEITTTRGAPRKAPPATKQPATRARAKAVSTPAARWVFDSGYGSHVCVCPRCSWRSVTSSEEDMHREAAEHDFVAHQQEAAAQAYRRWRARQVA